jgi:hypothetical protein
LPTPASCKNQQTTASGNEARQSGTDDGAGNRRQLASDLTTGVDHSVDVKIGLSAFDSRDQRRLGLWEPALEGDEGRIVDQRLREIEDYGG